MSQKTIMNDDDIVKDNQTDDLVFNPYNPLNNPVKESDIFNILKEYGLPERIHNMELYRRAFIHRSYTKRPHLEILMQPKHRCARWHYLYLECTWISPIRHILQAPEKYENCAI